MPVIFPRNGFTLLDGRALKLMERYDVRVPDLLIIGSMSGSVWPRNWSRPVYMKSLRRCGPAAADLTTKLEADLRSFDPTLRRGGAEGRGENPVSS